MESIANKVASGELKVPDDEEELEVDADTIPTAASAETTTKAVTVASASTAAGATDVTSSMAKLSTDDK